MVERTLRNCRVLVVEDEYMIAEDLARELGDFGAVVIGPLGTVEDALAMIATEPHIDGAVLDVNLRGAMVFAVADMLTERRVPFVFATGYDASIFPARFANVSRCDKPISMMHVARAIGRLIHP